MPVIKPAARYPADPRAVFILAFSVFTGFAALLLTSGPGSLNSVLPTWAVYTWGATLAAGSAVALIGMLFQTLNGIIAEQVGSIAVGSATLFYSGVIFFLSGSPGAAQPMSIILAWGLACFIRWAQLQALINDSYRQQVREEVEKEVLGRGPLP